jgi:hypothetical protein
MGKMHPAQPPVCAVFAQFVKLAMSSEIGRILHRDNRGPMIDKEMAAGKNRAVDN